MISLTISPIACQEPEALNAATGKFKVCSLQAFFCWLIAFVLACGWDRAVWLLVSTDKVTKLQWLEDTSTPAAIWNTLTHPGALGAPSIPVFLFTIAYAGLYFIGQLWIWILLGVVLIFQGWSGTNAQRVGLSLRRGLWIFAVPAGAGLLADGLKLITRRMRPEVADGHYLFRPYTDQLLSTSKLGLASSHAAVAIAGVLALGILWPRSRWIMIPLALLCALSRIAVGAHYLSDVVAGVGIGLLAYRLGYVWDTSRNPGRPLRPVPVPPTP